MRILVFGAAGKLGRRICASAIARGHTPIAFIRDKTKFESSTSSEVLNKLEIIQGDAEQLKDVKGALIESKCEVFVNCAGKPSATTGTGPKSNQGIIGMIIIDACLELYKEEQTVFRGWWVTGMVLMDEPGTTNLLHDRIVEFRPEHRATVQRLLSTPTTSIQWSILCPSLMFPGPDSSETPSSYPLQPSEAVLFSDTFSTPSWIWLITMTLLWLRNLVGSKTPFVMMPLVLWLAVPMAGQADTLVTQLGEDKWIGKRVGSTSRSIWETWGWT